MRVKASELQSSSHEQTPNNESQAATGSMDASPPTLSELEVGTNAGHPRARVQEQQAPGSHTRPLSLQNETGVEEERVHLESVSSITRNVEEVLFRLPDDPSQVTRRHGVKGNRAGSSGFWAHIPATAIPSSAKPEPASLGRWQEFKQMLGSIRYLWFSPPLEGIPL